MVTTGNKVMQILNRPSFSIKHCKIENMMECFDSGVSIQSLYSWSKPKRTLRHIYQILESNSIFVLATANDKLNLEPLINDAEKVLAGHPHMEIYKQLNLQFANAKGYFISLDELIRVVQSIGFFVLEAHQNYFHGGINFLILEKKVM